MKKLAFILALFAVASLAGAELPNPFTSSGGPSVAARAMPATNALAALAPLLRALTDRLTELAHRISESPRPGTFLTLAAFALLYGIFHSLGPGHGKTVVTTFFLSRDAKIRHSLEAGALLALFQAISATAMVFALYFVVRGVFSSGFESASRIVQIVSFGLITALGGVMLVGRILGAGRQRHDDHERKEAGHDCHEDEPHGVQAGTEGAAPTASGKDLLGIALAAGVVPCPGASAIILVCLSLNAMVVGLVAVTMFAVGMSLTVSAFGAIAILAKRGILKVSEKGKDEGHSVTRRIVEIAGAAILFVFGLAFLLAQF